MAQDRCTLRKCAKSEKITWCGRKPSGADSVFESADELLEAIDGITPYSPCVDCVAAIRKVADTELVEFGGGDYD